MIGSFGVEQIGFWSPEFPTYDAWKNGAAVTDGAQPACAVVTGRAKRGTSRITRMLGEVAIQAAEGAALGETPIIFASAWGEIDTMIELLNQIVDGAEGLSPLRFKNSVHNAASGLVSIATKNRAFSTAIAAGRQTFGCGLLEALTNLEQHDEVILCVGDDCLPEPLDRYSDYESLAVSLRLSRTASSSAFAVLSKFEMKPDSSTADPNTNPTADGLPLLRAIGEGANTARVGNWTLELSFPNAGSGL